MWTELVRQDFEKQYREVLASQLPIVQRRMECLVQVIAGSS